MQLIFATSNPSKISEISARIGSKIQISSLADNGIHEDIPEPFLTFGENALHKARYVYKKLGISCFADDSGLEVDALGGEPGVFSARYAQKNDFAGSATELVLQKLDQLHNAGRGAQFVTVIALILDGEEFLFKGTVRGSIIKSPRGTDGFGYDPIFVPEGWEKTFAEVDKVKKNQISHRSVATGNLLDFLALKGLL